MAIADDCGLGDSAGEVQVNRHQFIQGKRQRAERYKRVLCVCSGGMLRSATAAIVLSQKPYSFNTRAAGTDENALVKVDEFLISWADEIVCMTSQHAILIGPLLRLHPNKRCVTLGIEDNFEYRDPALIAEIMGRYP